MIPDSGVIHLLTGAGTRSEQIGHQHLTRRLLAAWVEQAMHFIFRDKEILAHIDRIGPKLLVG